MQTILDNDAFSEPIGIAGNDTLSEPTGIMDNSTLSEPTGELSDEQEKVIIVLQICSATLSLIGSCTIVFKILRCLYQKKSTAPLDRIILGLSSCDIFSSISSNRVWAFGSPETCYISGFLMQLACVWAIWYNCILSFYYLLTVRFQVKRRDFRRKYEIWLHLSGIFFPITAITGYIMGEYREQDLSMLCWIKTPIVGYIFGAIPIVITFLSVIINNIVIYAFVRTKLFSVQTQSRSRNFSVNDIENNGSNHGSNNGSCEDFVEFTSVQRRLKKEAAVQGFLYVASFLLTTTPIFVIQVLGGSFGYDQDDQTKIYPLLVLNAILLPLPGFFNVFIYVRPTYMRFRAAYPKEYWWFVLYDALFDPDIPKMTADSRSIVTSTRHPTARSRTSKKSSRPKSKTREKSLPSIVEDEFEPRDSDMEEDVDIGDTGTNTLTVSQLGISTEN